MPVIFKEKNFDRTLILIKYFLVIILVLLIALIIVNYNLKNKNNIYQSKLEQLKKEADKYFYLNKEKSKNKNQQNITPKKYILLKTLAAKTENVIFNSVYFKNNKIILNAESENQKNIFKFIEHLKTNNNLTNINLVKIRQNNKYFFQLEANISR
jgi:nitrate reductase NapAB chaperone NapD